MKFLHISDVHLGCTRYQLAESPRDFFDAWIDVLQKYAIGEKVDFVIMCGDFFHKRNVPPETMNYAFAGLSLLKDAGIPFVGIEGNHDQRHTDSDYSWLRSLANWNLIYLLEPKNIDGKIIYEEWNPDTGKGGFVDIGKARIFGSNWYGASANWAIPMLTSAIKENSREGAFQILMLHTDVEGHTVSRHHIPALSESNLKELKGVTNYVGLGHTHMSIEIDNWAFNPGSLEVTSIDEYNNTRGAFLVEINENFEVTAKHITDYKQRPFQRLSYDVSKAAEASEVTNGVLNKVRNEAKVFDETVHSSKPIIEITLQGHLGFPNSTLEQQKIREETLKLTDALHVRVKNHTAPIEYAVAADVGEDVSREQLERRVVEDLIVRDNRYKTRASEMAEAIIGSKRMALSDESPEKIVDFIALKIV
ncbi:MAG TPA: exonuclease SbcCD subunit D [Pyrinomonadaceae bacterium]|nr:exonuclease SbcCD subunit D [Pyrinomonadaceae bacterium]